MRWVRALVERARARVALRGCALGDGVRVGGRVQLQPRGSVSLGAGVELRGGPLPIEIVAAPGARVEIGARTVLEAGCSIVAGASIRIGAGCTLGRRARLRDAAEAGCGPVAIGDGAWIGHDVLVEPGVSIGAGAVVAPGAVVTADVPAGATVVGSPARVELPRPA